MPNESNANRSRRAGRFLDRLPPSRAVALPQPDTTPLANVVPIHSVCVEDLDPDDAPAKRARAPRIWAVGAGKGGVGKTLVASSLAVTLARSGMRCVAVDADFGAANLHTLLGVPEPRWLLRHFLGGEVRDLGEIACATPVPNLKLISGARAPVYAANLGHPQRQKLLRHLRRLDTDHVILDLGAGSSFNELDFFVSADLNLVVVTPERTAIENAYQFVKAAWFRVMRPAALRPEVRESLRLVLGDRQNQRSLPPRELLDAVSQVDAHAGSQLRRLSEAFRPALVMNRVTSSAERALADQVALTCRDALGANVRSVGCLRQDEAVPLAVDREYLVREGFYSRFTDDVYRMILTIATNVSSRESSVRSLRTVSAASPTTFPSCIS